MVPTTDGEVPGPSSVQTMSALVEKAVEVEPVIRSVENEDMIVTVAEVNEAKSRLCR